MSKERYIIQMLGGLEPVVHGPYKNEGSRTRAVRKLHREMDYEDNVFALNMFPVEAWAWSAGFFEDSDHKGPLGNPGRGPSGIVKGKANKGLEYVIMSKLGY